MPKSPKSSDKNPSDQKSYSELSDIFINFTLSVNDIVIVYISGLLVVVGALLNNIQSTLLAQIILTGLIIVGSLTVYATIYAIQFPYKDERIAVALIRGSAKLMRISWVLTLVITLALIVLIIFA